MQKERERQAMEDVDRHFQLSMELAKKVNIESYWQVLVKENLMYSKHSLLTNFSNFWQTDLSLSARHILSSGRI